MSSIGTDTRVIDHGNTGHGLESTGSDTGGGMTFAYTCRQCQGIVISVKCVQGLHMGDMGFVNNLGM